ncbi:hypothetical protein [Collimonas antrihumi]|nr:hypothetical protein [Collimonas antrihumi]
MPQKNKKYPEANHHGYLVSDPDPIKTKGPVMPSVQSVFEDLF